MNTIKFEINNIPLENFPTEYNDFTVTADFVNSRSLEVGIDRITITGEHDVSIINNHISNYGYLVGVPFKVLISDESGTFEDLPEMYLDLKDNIKFINDYAVECSVKLVNQKDWFSENSVFSFNYLDKELNLFSSSDIAAVKYHLNFRDTRIAFVTLLILSFQLKQLIAKAIQDLQDSIAEVQDAATPGVSIAGPVAVIGAIILAVLKGIARIAYNLIMIAYVIDAIKGVIGEIYSITRHHYGVYDRRLLEIGCQHMGLTFKSSLFEAGGDFYNSVSLPSKTRKGNVNPSAHQDYVFSQRDSNVYFFNRYFESVLSMCNADYKISNGVLRLERWDYWQNIGTYRREDNLNDQNGRNTIKENNSVDFIPEYLISFSEDVTDRNTIENFEGTNYDVITEPVATLGNKYDNGGGTPTEIRIPFALATISGNDLTALEKLLKAVASLADIFTGNNLASQITSRPNDMVLSEHTFDVPKKIIVQTNSDNSCSVSSINRYVLRCSYLWENYHYINSFKPINNKHNQWEIYKDQRTQFCKVDLEKLLNSNYTVDGEEITKVVWNIFTNLATIDYRINNLYDTNLSQTFIEAGNGENGTSI